MTLPSVLNWWPVDAVIAGGDLELGGREEDRQEAARHQVVELLFRLGQVLRRLRGRDDREVVARSSCC